MKKASIIICTYNDDPYYFEECIKSALRQTRVDYEIIVVDMSTNKNVKDICKKYPRLKYHFYKKSSGLSDSKNYGIKRAKGEIIIFLDADGIPSDNWLKEYLKFFNKFEDYGIAGGKILPLWEEEPLKIFKESNLIKSFFSALDLGSEIFETERIFGGNSGFRRVVFKKVGDFNVNLGRKKEKLISGEETEFYNRALKFFKIAYLPNAMMRHLVKKERTTFLWIMKRSYFGGLSKALVKLKPKAIQSKKNFYDYLALLFITPPYFLGYVKGRILQKLKK